jgi:D-psicose/D-tagatose/L-ribulose 3-epimerase
VSATGRNIIRGENREEAVMKFGINTFLFQSPFTDKGIEYFSLFKDLGFDSVEIALENRGDMDYKQVLKGLKKAGLDCCTVCGAFGPDRDLRGTEEQQNNSKDYVKECIDACVALECDLFAGPLYSAVGHASMYDEATRKKHWATCAKNLKELCAYAGERGVYIAVEPLNRFETDFINTAAQAKRMVEDVGSDRLKIHLDTFHMNIEEKSIPMALLDTGDLLYHVHSSENDRGAPGTGTVNWAGVRDALRQIGYERAVVIESFTPEVEIIARAASIWRYTEKTGIDLARKGVDFLKALFAA